MQFILKIRKNIKETIRIQIHTLTQTRTIIMTKDITTQATAITSTPILKTKENITEAVQEEKIHTIKAQLDYKIQEKRNIIELKRKKR